MKDRIRWGLLSTARINKAIIPAIKASKRSDLVAVASRSLENARAYARKMGIPNAFGSYDEMLRSPDVDIIYIPLPNNLHAEWSIKALEAGKHVLCEKPLALSLNELDTMKEAAKKTGKRLAEAFMYRHHPQTLLVQDLVNSGEIGKVILIRGCFSFVLDRPDDIRWDSSLGGGSLWDVGCYPVSFSRMIAGCSPNEVLGWEIACNSGVDSTFVGQLRYPNGIIAQFDSSFTLPLYTYMEIRGSEGTIIIPSPFKPEKNDEIIIMKEGKPNKKIKAGGNYVYIGEVEDMENAILGGKPNRLSLDESRENIATLLALLRSVKK